MRRFLIASVLFILTGTPAFCQIEAGTALNYWYYVRKDNLYFVKLRTPLPDCELETGFLEISTTN